MHSKELSYGMSNGSDVNLRPSEPPVISIHQSWKVQLFDEERRERDPARGLPSRVLKAFSASTLTKLLDFKCKLHMKLNN